MPRSSDTDSDPPDVPAPSDARAAALRAARAARAIAGDEAAGDGPARRDAFATLLYGLASGFAMRDRGAADPAAAGSADGPASDLADRTEAIALDLLRQAMGMGFREASRTLDAISDALIADGPDDAVLGLVQAGVAAAGDWSDIDRRPFESRVLQATAGETFASQRPLLAR
jgi:hypothetical protein